MPHDQTQAETGVNGQEPTASSAQTAESATTSAQPASDEGQARIQQLEQEVGNLKDQYLRAVADLKNFKRRTEDERATLIRNATAGLIMKLLPILDDFDLAVQHVSPEVAESPWFNGLQGVQRKLQVVLESEGVKAIDAQGQTFDPNFHEAVMHEDAGPEQAGKVTADLRKGYTLHDKVIRPSMVKVGQE